MRVTCALLIVVASAAGGCQWIAGTEDLVETPAPGGGSSGQGGAAGASVGGGGTGQGGGGGTGQGGAGGVSTGGGGAGGAIAGGGGAGGVTSGGGSSGQGGAGGIGVNPDAGDSSLETGVPDVSVPDADAGDGAVGRADADAGVVTKLSLGATCSQGAQCQSGNCVDSICCDGACAKECEQCQPVTGQCTMVSDDSACGTINCNANTACVTYQSVAGSRCKARGVCKTATDCPAQNAPARTACGADPAHMICDGQGACVTPTVPCTASAGACTVSNTSICCGYGNMGSDYSLCGVAPSSCPADVIAPTMPIECNQALDCALGTVCCYVQYKFGNYARCMATCPAPVPMSTTSFQLCSPTEPNACPFGTTCTAAPATGWPSYMSTYHYCQ